MSNLTLLTLLIVTFSGGVFAIGVSSVFVGPRQ